MKVDKSRDESFEQALNMLSMFVTLAVVNVDGKLRVVREEQLSNIQPIFVTLVVAKVDGNVRVVREEQS